MTNWDHICAVCEDIWPFNQLTKGDVTRIITLFSYRGCSDCDAKQFDCDHIGCTKASQKWLDAEYKEDNK